MDIIIILVQHQQAADTHQMLNDDKQDVVQADKKSGTYVRYIPI